MGKGEDPIEKLLKYFSDQIENLSKNQAKLNENEVLLDKKIKETNARINELKEQLNQLEATVHEVQALLTHIRTEVQLAKEKQKPQIILLPREEAKRLIDELIG